MWTIKERIACFLVIMVLVVILFTPAQGYCVVLKGNLVRPGPSQIPLSNVRVFLYEWDLVKQQGLVTIAPITKTGITVGGRNFEVDLKDTVSLDKEYLLLFSTQEIATITSFPSFFYGAYNEADYSNPSKFIKQPRWDLTNVPKIRFTSGTFDLGTFNPPYTGADEGVWLFGFIKDENGNLKKDVGVEIYGDQNGIPVLLPYPFYRYVKTDEPDSLGRNFKIGGLLKNTKYYIKLIANHLGYIDTFYTKQDPNVPTQFILTGNYVADEFRLTRKGARIWGYLKDKENNNPITKSVILIQAVSYPDDQQVQFMQNYVHDPNYHRFDQLSDVDKHFFGYDRFNYNSNGLYEMKGLPFEGHDYILVATELPGETPKKFVTPLFYDGNDGVFNINQAKTISLPGAGTSYRVDFILIKPCEGDFDSDGDVDGSDLAVFAADFGRTDCQTGPICEGDFDSDGDVDGSDLAIFAADFGRTDCPITQ